MSEGRDPARATDPWRYDGRVALVTGASSGIGAATVAELTRLGATVIGLDVRDTSAAHRHVVADIGADGGVERALDQVGRPVDALFNCAGITGNNPLQRVIRVNFLGLRRLSDAVAATMPPGGAIVSVASVGGGRWRENVGAITEFLSLGDWEEALRWCERHPEQFPRGGYSFTKQCVIAWTMASCVALGQRGIRINCISPGNVETPMLQDAAAIGGRAAVEAVPRPLGRNSTPEEQARALAFLNGHAASYITGQELWTDGGLLGGIALGVHEYPLVASPQLPG